MLVRCFDLVDEIRGVPVLFSMLVLIFSEESDSDLPQSRLDLYKTAMDVAIRKALRKVSGCKASVAEVHEMLRKLAYEHHAASVKTFTSKKVARLIEEPAMLETWNRFVEEEHLPAIKIVTAPDAAGNGGEFQFAHLSFQEYMFIEVRGARALSSRADRFLFRTRLCVTNVAPAQAFQVAGAIPSSFKWKDMKEKATFLRNTWFKHAIELGGARARSRIAKVCRG